MTISRNSWHYRIWKWFNEGRPTPSVCGYFFFFLMLPFFGSFMLLLGLALVVALPILMLVDWLVPRFEKLPCLLGRVQFKEDK